ncbi:Hsp70 family protein [Cellvibrio japonicus]|uniref:Chaperone protein hscC n=1 Tax=Cellvibrio japonicus (strain Ueda107) TaxID=498211 RepID=B3PBV5_CELJU|nr:Hsp70 family protein [Cellvibrio japonicus]ACE83812.1 chaperone protein hscC [Cellvibrio japonicus Ueda107]QEI11771.1 molecular chaperone HscC [Cellvibrio japonicus]QEI15345.1 molecular chaperone HscC [Cellvibrio japonicus]QEI18925.1 molecular chaperone HscC [Cellvibrio japonicus]
MAIIGIDLGTTNSSCGIWTPEGVKLIPNRLGDYLTPSVVGLDDSGNLSVGRIAKERLISHSDKTVAVFKRLMGTEHKIKIGNRFFSATELSAIVLRSLKEDAETFLGEPVVEAVISVPAYFNDNQRHATKMAGELAGFKVERLINEPTAAAIAYGLHEKQEGTFLILDMGGGTFDVSILEFFEGVMEVHASAGDNFLGGEDFVDAMVDDLLNQYSINRQSLAPAQLNQLLMQMETAKRRISSKALNPIQITLAGQQIDFQPDEAWFTKVVTPLLLRAKRPIERALNDATMSPQSIDDVVLVGGATRMGVFRSMIGRMFGRLPSCHLDPDCAIAMGAAIQAGLKAKDQALNDIVLTDVCPYTLGTDVVNESNNQGGYFLPIIERNSVVPISVTRRLVTVHDNQAQISVGIYQGENRLVNKNVFLGKVSIDIPKAPAGKEGVDVRYSYDMNGLLEVDVTVISTGKAVNKVIEHSPGALTAEEIEKSRQKLAALKFHPRDQESNRALIARGERLYESSLGEKRQQIAQLLADFDQVLERQNPPEIQKAAAQLETILNRLDNEEWF